MMKRHGIFPLLGRNAPTESPGAFGSAPEIGKRPWELGFLKLGSRWKFEEQTELPAVDHDDDVLDLE
jgi:hypothetical protein